MPSLRHGEWRLFSLQQGPWLLTCALTWVVVGAIAAVGGVGPGRSDRA